MYEIILRNTVNSDASLLMLIPDGLNCFMKTNPCLGVLVIPYVA